jgi:hypothetical protein
MTGMPGFGEMVAQDQIWRVSMLLANADKLPAQTQAALAKSGGPAEPGVTPAPAPAPQTRKKK